MIDKVIECIHSNSSFVIVYHQNPDGDAIGSALALSQILKTLKKDVRICSRERIPNKYSFLPDVKYVEETRYLPESDVLILLECGCIERSGFERGDLNSRIIVNIDHHTISGDFTSVNWVDSSASATAELIYYLAKALETPITQKIAVCLYVGILTDTGKFQYSNTHKKLYNIIAELVDTGISVSDVYHHVYGSQSPAYCRLLGYVLSNFKFRYKDKISYVVISDKVIRECDASKETLEGIIDYIRDIAGVEAAVLFRELKENIIKVGLRSINLVSVDEFAARYKGGGHKRAAGCTIKGSLDETVDSVLKDLEDYCKKYI
ncbi:MAG: bifunctional oligoribonuclease/PAP phosphatase NrnA [Elusimicrobiota bacterium]